MKRPHCHHYLEDRVCTCDGNTGGASWPGSCRQLLGDRRLAHAQQPGCPRRCLHRLRRQGKRAAGAPIEHNPRFQLKMGRQEPFYRARPRGPWRRLRSLGQLGFLLRGAALYSPLALHRHRWHSGQVRCGHDRRSQGLVVDDVSKTGTHIGW